VSEKTRRAEGRRDVGAARNWSAVPINRAKAAVDEGDDAKAAHELLWTLCGTTPKAAVRHPRPLRPRHSPAPLYSPRMGDGILQPESGLLSAPCQVDGR
jgi:hypothetical protein